MTPAVFLHPEVASAAVGDTVRLDGPEGHHASLVRRIGTGEELVLTDGRGTRARCRAGVVGRGTLEAEVLAVEELAPEMPRLVVVQALAKGDRGERAVEMLTEVGADVILPWAASRSVVRWNRDRADKALARWRSAAREAAKQARRSWFPEVHEVASTADVAVLLAGASVPVVLHEAASGPLADVPVPGRGEVVIVVGPEGGISEEELAAFGSVGAEPLRLGSSVLRSSTAGVAAAAALLSRTPRWR